MCVCFCCAWKQVQSAELAVILYESRAGRTHPDNSPSLSHPSLLSSFILLPPSHPSLSVPSLHYCNSFNLSLHTSLGSVCCKGPFFFCFHICVYFVCLSSRTGSLLLKQTALWVAGDAVHTTPPVRAHLHSPVRHSLLYHSSSFVVKLQHML